MSIWDRYAAVVTARRSWALLLVLAAVVLAAFLGIAGNDSAGESPRSLPDTAQSARLDNALEQFPETRTAAAIAVVTRVDGGGLGVADRDAAAAALARAATAARAGGPSGEFSTAPDGAALLGPIPLPADLNGSALTDRVTAVRAAAADALPSELRLEITGGPAFAADIADAFSGADITLLAVTAAVVAALLLVTYRSPVLWLIPLLIIGAAEQTANRVGIGLSRLTGLAFDGSTAGITSVLVFGAGTNYALLLISRYRDELHHHRDHRQALRRAARRAAPAILASNLTVVMALLILLLAVVPSTRSLGAFAAAGLLVALLFVLAGLPPALALCGRKVFWPFVPRADDRDTAAAGVWRAVAAWVVVRPARVAAVAVAALIVCAVGLLTVDVGLSQTEQFRVRAESVTGFDTLAAHFPSGAADPTQVVANAAAAPEVTRTLSATPGVVQATPAGISPSGLARWTVTLDAAPASEQAFATIATLRERLAAVPDAQALVGGNDARAFDARAAAERDRAVVVPLILVVVCGVLLALLRAVPAALLLVAVTAASAMAALGVGSWLSVHVFGFPAIDVAVPLFAFLFLVGLGVDYTIFLVSRAREETPGHGTRFGMVRAVSTTGAVITSAGIVLAAVFAVLGVLPLITLTQLGIVVGVGILLDTFVVRTVIVPALFTLLGARVWWPSRLSRPSLGKPFRRDASSVPSI